MLWREEWLILSNVENRVIAPIKATQDLGENTDFVEKQNNNIMVTDKVIFCLRQGNFT